MLARRRGMLLAFAIVIASGLGAVSGRAGVPRSCIHPHFDPLRCARDTRSEHRDVLPSARLRQLDAQRPRLEDRVPLQDAERNALLKEIHELLLKSRPPATSRSLPQPPTTVPRPSDSPS